jgi:hypothetical protein
MTTSKKLKICTIVSHAFIVVGFGHGILFFFLLDIAPFAIVTKNNFSFLLNSPFESRLPLVGLTCLLGQIGILISIFNSNNKTKLLTQIIGLCLLWLSILYFVWTLRRDSYVHFAAITALPFCICTIATFLGRPIQKAGMEFKRWVVDNY